MKMIIEAIKAEGNDGEKIHDWVLQNARNWKGFMGNVTMDDKGNTNSGFTLKVVENGSFVHYLGTK
jgi:ABC-type branched-subunit amino acid transport system substrate-binding protein